MAQCGERLRIPFTGEDRADDPLTRPSTELTDDVRELDIHLRERFLHALDAGADSVDIRVVLTPRARIQCERLRRTVCAVDQRRMPGPADSARRAALPT